MHDRRPAERDQRNDEADTRGGLAPGQTVCPRHRRGRVRDAARDEPPDLERRRDMARVVNGLVPRPRVPHEVHGERRDDGERAPAERRIEQCANRRGDDEDEADPGRHERREQQCRGHDRRPPPSLLDGDEAPHAERDGADEARLERPEEVLRAAPEQQQGDREERCGQSPDASSDEDVHAGDGDRVEDDHLSEIGQVGVEADDVKGGSIREQRERRPVLVDGSEEVRPPSVERDRAPLVVPERERAAEVENHCGGEHSHADERQIAPRDSACLRGTRAHHDASLSIPKPMSAQASNRRRERPRGAPPG